MTTKKQTAFINENGRIECDNTEFRSGDVVQVFIKNKWHTTRIEFFNNQYQSIDGFPLIGYPVK